MPKVDKTYIRAANTQFTNCGVCFRQFIVVARGGCTDASESQEPRCPRCRGSDAKANRPRFVDYPALIAMPVIPPQEWEDKTACVYFMRNPYNIAAGVKIGVAPTGTVGNRAKAAITWTPGPLECMGLIRCPDPSYAEMEEKKYHKKFDHVRVRPGGAFNSEWFYPIESLLTDIRLLSSMPIVQ